MRDALPFVIVSCQGCGPVAVETCTFEVHADADDGVALYAFTCPGCGEVGTGGCRELIARLLTEGVRRRELRSMQAAPITGAEIAAFRRWLDGDPVWHHTDEPSVGDA
jgi:hypothetical protein